MDMTQYAGRRFWGSMTRKSGPIRETIIAVKIGQLTNPSSPAANTRRHHRVRTALNGDDEFRSKLQDHIGSFAAILAAKRVAPARTFRCRSTK